MKHNFEERRQNRIDHAKEQAEKNEHKAQALHSKAKQMASFIPMGQPILVGHHSEKSDRSFRNKIHNTFGKAFEADDKAAYYSDKADTIEGSTAIFSDDPEAVTKLEEKLKDLERLHQFMKDANKCIKKKDKDGFIALGGTEKQWEEVIATRFGYTGFWLSNSSQNIASVKKRIAYLKTLSVKQTNKTMIGEVEIVENVEANRLQVFFPAIPDEQVRTKLKQNGFRWCRSEGAWQRHLTPAALYAIKDILGG